jgi:hypothetical protein
MKKINLLLVVFSMALISANCNGPSNPPVVVQTDIGGDGDVLPIDRVKLKPSPRAIITWNGRSPKDTLADFWDLGQISAKKGQNDLLVEFVNGPDRSVLMQIPLAQTLNAQIGVYSYRFKDDTQNDQIVIFYSENESMIKPYVFNVLNAPPYIELVTFEPPNTQILTPIPYFNFYCDGLRVYNDDMYRNRINTFIYTGQQMNSILN